ncbi:bifunctional serine/threonine-protein kinase/formylglycine-generating enzyme family protein [Haliangium ochraceum]|uniref:Serine/threonine protein kinase n=1 Tax=Haliangium ochraceum (strain DSM 14365 / JCM 11303 / SMP-2) TaxID=502025 RepID=D0LK13_HALO1|nr:bifunctional serine/threonine-protein kinase/formylglycine-generating enzyme family protein [Haliangium ochraceum]ACY18520.1 serine/threonine protein kinase [Haliangium ochraceum DSM 14365]
MADKEDKKEREERLTQLTGSRPDGWMDQLTTDATIVDRQATQATQVTGPRPFIDTPDAPMPGGDRYRVQRVLGEGGMSRVYLALDRDLRREVALKVLRVHGPEMRERFLEEAQVVAQLEHPNIVPLYDIGHVGTNRMFCSMRYVRGQTLRMVLGNLRDGSPEAMRTYSLTRLMQIFLQVAQAVGYAHAKGVVHRDIKPANVMLGEHGEVQVLDWGLAKVLDPQVVETSGAIHLTHAGQIMGTPAYMAPEQVDGSDVDQRADVYALGVILYELLTLELPIYRPTLRALITALLTETPRPPHERLPPNRQPPSELENICMRALQKEPSARQRNARELADAVQHWLEAEADRARRHQLAEEKAELGRDKLAAYVRLKDEVVALEAEAESLEKRFQSWQSVVEKAPLYQAQDRSREARRQLTETASDVVAVLTEALGFERENRSALELLADYYYDRFRDAEKLQNAEEVDFFGKLVAKYHGGKYSRALSGEGSLALRSDPPGAEVALYRLEEQQLIMVPVLEETLGQTPVEPVPLPMGSYLVVLSKPGYRALRYPVYISRNRNWSGEVRLYRDDEIGPDFVHIPGGPFIQGGDPHGGWSLPRSEPYIDDFFIGRDPVTLSEYMEFLDALADSDIEEARARAPRRTPDGGAYLDIRPRGRRSRFRLPTHDGLEDGEGEVAEASGRESIDIGLQPRAPVCGISWFDAVAYCEWRSRRDGCTYRLPSDTEWEKSARGVDGRWFPWGNRFDASLCNMRESQNGRAALAPVDKFETDVSIYGVRGMSGNIRDWTATESIEGEGENTHVYRVVRGGAWYGGRTSARCADRFWFEPPHVYFFVGFRLARSPGR